jgi:uncharacterized RDD family membrane protein YckC
MSEQRPPRTTSGYTTMPPPGAGGPPVAPEAMGPVADRHVLAGWWPRVGATLIDWVIVGLGAIVLTVALTAPFSIGFFAGDDVGFLIAVVCVSIVALLYAPALMARTNGQTLGKMALGIRVVRANGKPVDFGYAMLREVAVKALLFGVAGGVTGGLAQLADCLWPLWDEENRALHDMIVDSRVISR